jgi:ribosomal protein L37AE/L43A
MINKINKIDATIEYKCPICKDGKLRVVMGIMVCDVCDYTRDLYSREDYIKTKEH